MTGKYRINEQLGKGATSVVYGGYNRKTEEKVAIKAIDSGNRRHLHLAANEIQVLKRLSHPNVIRMVESVETSKHTLIVLEKCRFSLSFIAKSGYLQSKVLLRIFRDVLVGLRYLHAMGIIHRDIKLGNVMVSEKNELKIIDFGLSKDTLFSSPKTFCGTPDFISPEVLERQPYTKKTDIYSAGMLLYFLIFRSDYSKEKLEHAKKTEKYAEMAELLEKMVERNPEKRVSAEEALSSKIFLPFLPQTTGLEGIKPFELKTKLGSIKYTQEIIRMETEEVIFFLRSDMNGIYQKYPKSTKEVYIPLVGVDTKTLKLVGFCYSVIGLIKKRTPVVIILTNKGKFFKMMKEGIYVYITEKEYLLWQKGEIIAKQIKTQERIENPEVSPSEMQALIHESIQILNANHHSVKPITIDKRTIKNGVLHHSIYSTMAVPSVDSATLANLCSAPSMLRKQEYSPVFTENGCILRIEPYLLTMHLFSGEFLILNLQEKSITQFSKHQEKKRYKLLETSNPNILQKVLLFEDLLYSH
ncbi:hypothetical protein NEFER03_0576 [Nematocida sp. LUAm3]|nr:hypothetical protein NEFER03_0576 [Nematocida sp. LUAm3]KAI5175543.1 hypothetical protein NEFER02_1449 [Nematocida sp. LUAm2]KAI5178427.1 hypothetical protein NEFER01_1574 [Nematocida sp. LUAm1]